ncbi:hypothetical protein Tco_0064053 [Tanacetum coccineum]
MANQEQNPPQQEQPFVAAKQVGFNLEDIILNPNNEVALLYPEHNNKDHFKCVSDLISKCCIRKPFTKSSNMYKEYLAEFWNAIGTHYLPHSSEYVAPSSIDINGDYKWTIIDENFFTNNPLSTKGNKVGSSKAPTVPKIAISKKRKEFSLAMDSNPSQPPVSTLVDTRMHKEEQQATGGPTSLWVTSEARANPQLNSGCYVSVDSTAEADPGLSAPSDFVPQQQGMNEGTKNTSYDHLSVDEVHPTPNAETKDTSVSKSSSPRSSQIQELTNQVLILQSQKHKLELEKSKAEAEATLLKAQTSFYNVEQLKVLLVNSLKTEFSNILSAHDFSSSLPTELKDLSSKLNELTREVNELKKQVHELEIELP